MSKSTMPEAPAVVRRRLEQVVRRIRLLYLVAGCSRVLGLALLAVVALYVADRFLELPVVVRALLLGKSEVLGKVRIERCRLQTWCIQPNVVSQKSGQGEVGGVGCISHQEGALGQRFLHCFGIAQ